MKIQWLGHASFLITGQSGVTIVTDPYEAGFHGVISYRALNQKADIVTVSHQHSDHNAVDAVWGQAEGSQSRRCDGGKRNQILGRATYHDDAGGTQRGPNVVFSFELDGLRVCHLGDLGHSLSEKQLAELRPVGVVLMPTGGPIATLELDEVIEVFGGPSARLGIAMHFKNDVCSFPRYTAADLLGRCDRARRVEGSELKVAKDDLPKVPEIVILDPNR